MKNYNDWLMENTGVQVIQAQISLNNNQLMIKTPQGSFDLVLTPQQVQDLTQKMGSMNVAQNPNNANPSAYQGAQQAQQ